MVRVGISSCDCCARFAETVKSTGIKPEQLEKGARYLRLWYLEAPSRLAA